MLPPIFCDMAPGGPSPSRLRRATSPKGGGRSLSRNAPQAPPLGELSAVRLTERASRREAAGGFRLAVVLRRNPSTPAYGGGPPPLRKGGFFLRGTLGVGRAVSRGHPALCGRRAGSSRPTGVRPSTLSEPPAKIARFHTFNGSQAALRPFWARKSGVLTNTARYPHIPIIAPARRRRGRA